MHFPNQPSSGVPGTTKQFFGDLGPPSTDFQATLLTSISSFAELGVGGESEGAPVLWKKLFQDDLKTMKLIPLGKHKCEV